MHRTPWKVGLQDVLLSTQNVEDNSGEESGVGQQWSSLRRDSLSLLEDPGR